MDVIAHAGAVGRRVVVAEDGELLSFTHRHLRDEGYQVVRDAAGIFTDEATYVGTDWVEVTQAGDGTAGVGLVKVGEDVFDDELALAVGVGGAQQEVFANRDRLWVSIDGVRGREDQGVNIGAGHFFAENDAAGDENGQVLQRGSNGI